MIATIVAGLLLAVQGGDGVTRVPAYVLVGQSNMEGYGLAADLAPAELAPDPNVRVWNWCATAHAWEDLAPGVNTNPLWDSACGGSGLFGPEVSLGKALSAHDAAPVHLVKVARGNTWLAPPAALDPCGAPCFDLSPDLSWDPAGGGLYARLVQELQLADAALPSGTRLDVRGVFFAQGVNDAFCACHADAYAARLSGFRAALRAELVALGVTTDPAVPFVLSWVPDRLPYVLGVLLPTGDVIRAAQLAVARADPRTALVETSELSVGPDGVHFDAAGQLQHGAELFAAFTATPLPVPTLSASASWTVASAGGVQVLRLVDPSAAGDEFLVLGSLSGTAGFDHLGVSIPLAPDPFLLLTLQLGFGGTLDGAGEASHAVVVPPLPGAVGLRAHHAFLRFDDSGDLTTIQGASNPIGLALIPDLPTPPL